MRVGGANLLDAARLGERLRALRPTGAKNGTCKGSETDKQNAKHTTLLKTQLESLQTAACNR